MNAVRKNCAAVGKWWELIEHRGVIDFTALQLAARAEHIDVARLLLEEGADAMATNFHGSVLHFVACRDGNDECLMLVLNAIGARNGTQLGGDTTRRCVRVFLECNLLLLWSRLQFFPGP